MQILIELFGLIMVLLNHVPCLYNLMKESKLKLHQELEVNVKSNNIVLLKSQTVNLQTLIGQISLAKF
jgi:hypothetical protein